jgi:hypothetical protein
MKSLPIINCPFGCSLLTAHCSLFTAHCLYYVIRLDQASWIPDQVGNDGRGLIDRRGFTTATYGLSLIPCSSLSIINYPFGCSLLTVHCSLLTAHLSLVAHCPLSIIHSVAHCSLTIIHYPFGCSLLIVNCSLLTANCLYYVIRLDPAAWIPALPVPDRGFGIKSGMTRGDSSIVVVSLRLLMAYGLSLIPVADCSLLIAHCKLLIQPYTI